ncbi:MAG: response regulator [Candidatus Omnitrophica bacterium]|nr:response regulator [Candidatus Omnitrophota bacterium]
MPKKILIIDDTETDRKIVTRFLNKAGYDLVLAAENGEQGVAMAASQKPDLVITDTMMPGLDGFETCRQIRAAHGQETMKIIVMTGAIDAVDAVKARKAGADDYCVKTSDAAPLMAAVKNCIGEA